MSPVFGNNDAKIRQKRLDNSEGLLVFFVCRVFFMNDDWSEKMEEGWIIDQIFCLSS